MKNYLLKKYSRSQTFTREHIREELLISFKEARELQLQILGTTKPMSFEDFVRVIESGLKE